MPRRFQHSVPDRLREPHEVEVPGVWNAYVLAIGIVVLMGLLSGSVWIVWRLWSASGAE